MNLRIHIDRLVLDGSLPMDQHSIGVAVEWELARLLSERGLPAGLGEERAAAPVAIHSRDGGSFQRRPVETTRSLGRQVAQGIYQALGHPQERGKR